MPMPDTLTTSSFNPRSPREERLPDAHLSDAIDSFNPRSPREERLPAETTRECAGCFNPRSPREERLSTSFLQPAV